MGPAEGCIEGGNGGVGFLAQEFWVCASTECWLLSVVSTRFIL